MNKKKLLILIDDDPSGFWAAPEEFWTPSHWNAYEIHTLPGDKVASIEDVIEEIKKVQGKKELFVITDGHLWEDPRGGGKLLQQLKDAGLLTRGAVYSNDPLLPAALIGVEGVIACTRTPMPEKKLQGIRLFLEKNQRPKGDDEPELSRRLSVAIHRLENLSLPLRVDAGTLHDSKLGVQISIDIWEEYFLEEDELKETRGADKPLGYLTAERSFTTKKGGIEYEIVEALRPLEQLADIKKAGILVQFCEGGELKPAKFCVGLGIADARAEAPRHKKDPEWLKEKLGDVDRKIRSLAGELRKVRAGEPA